VIAAHSMKETTDLSRQLSPVRDGLKIAQDVVLGWFVRDESVPSGTAEEIRCGSKWFASITTVTRTTPGNSRIEVETPPPPNKFVISTGEFIGFQPTQGDEKRGLDFPVTHRTVIPTEAYLDFLPRSSRQSLACASP
jgi:hypothetical protein